MKRFLLVACTVFVGAELAAARCQGGLCGEAGRADQRGRAGRSGPWVTLDFHTVSTGDVTLTIQSGLASTEYLSNVLFNVAGTATGGLSIAHLTGPAAVTIDDPAGGTDGTSLIEAGLFSVSLDYSNKSFLQFRGGATSVYEMTGAGITAQSFDAPSLRDGSIAGGYVAAAEVQGIPNGPGNGSIGQLATVPEPSTAVLGTLALIGVLVGRRAVRQVRA